MPVVYLGIKRIPLDNIVLPGNYRKICEEDADDIKEMADNIDKVGMAHLPIIRERDMKLIVGLHRYAASRLLSWKLLEARMVQCTDEEAIVLAKSENLFRKHDPERRAREMDEFIQQMAATFKTANPQMAYSGRGRRKTSIGLAREAIAMERGISPESVRQQQWRDRKRKEKLEKEKAAKEQGAAAPVQATEKNPPIDTLGMELEESYLASVESVQRYLTDCLKSLRQAKGSVDKIESAMLPRNQGRINRLLEEIGTTIEVVKALKPTMLCPFCKGIQKVQEKCAFCETSGYITVNQEKQVPHALLDLENPKVQFDGKMLPIAEVLGERTVVPLDDDDPWRLG